MPESEKGNLSLAGEAALYDFRQNVHPDDAACQQNQPVTAADRGTPRIYRWARARRIMRSLELNAYLDRMAQVVRARNHLVIAIESGKGA